MLVVRINIFGMFQVIIVSSEKADECNIMNIWEDYTYLKFLKHIFGMYKSVSEFYLSM